MKNKILFIAILLIITSCAKQQDLTNCLTGEPEGFISGIIHGLISPFAFISMLFNDDVIIYSSNNDGKWYALGFIIGTGGFTKIISFVKDFFKTNKNKESNQNT
ncbi:hypothetical protein [Polaribacter sp. AHE13PA]|jgi:hypothetical protein|uniref:hypothetical protein n=1 Tax=Polaribacter sp. AHE13PA TaxID=2745562 RepID=UPI001C4FEEFC|nr:hypothetical protein [Polaribacter sp. AHE13PA]QXP65759.1 hypothetical protein H0I28_11170 [Polaribacter sp. AHE13PA]